jgi:hypothetical protein
VRGARTPFVLSGGEFNDYMAYDLQVWNRSGRPNPPCTSPCRSLSACGAESGRAGQHGRVQEHLWWADASSGLFARGLAGGRTGTRIIGTLEPQKRALTMGFASSFRGGVGVRRAA